MTQLISGIEKPIDYLEKSWVLTVRETLKALKAAVWTEKIWRPEKTGG